jgi:AcrR family transcriptional regulator
MSDNPTDITHERILNCSIVLFARSGFHGVSMRQVAEAVGVTVGRFVLPF